MRGYSRHSTTKDVEKLVKKKRCGYIFTKKSVGNQTFTNYVIEYKKKKGQKLRQQHDKGMFEPEFTDLLTWLYVSTSKLKTW